MIIQLEPVKSSNIEAIGHDLNSSTLAVKFKSGLLYHYVGVPLSEFVKLKDADSIGTYFSRFIRSRFTGTPQPKEKA